MLTTKKKKKKKSARHSFGNRDLFGNKESIAIPHLPPQKASTTLGYRMESKLLKRSKRKLGVLCARRGWALLTIEFLQGFPLKT